MAWRKQRTEVRSQPPCISAAPAPLDRYLAASPAMSLIPVAPFIKITASQGGQPPAPEGAYAPVGGRKSEDRGRRRLFGQFRNILIFVFLDENAEHIH